ncbi:MAG: hypothetical protein NT154_05280 [Verrucomicrobia bacterium]|nr:hypothetical protein [Verrucomicrobiota bacterium]
MRVASLTTIVFLSGLLCGCASKPRSPGVDLAVNLGIEEVRDVERLHDAIASAGIRCGMRAMSLNAEQIVVSPSDFEKARAFAVEFVARESLTVRLWKWPHSPLLEVWEKGRMIREEPYKLYPWKEETIKAYKEQHAREQQRP